MFTIVGIFNFGLSRVLSYLSVRHLGANQASALSLNQVLFAFVFAAIFIGEVPTPLILVGALLVVIGAMVIEARAGALKRGGRRKIGLLAIILSGVVRGVTPVIIQHGLSSYPFAVSGTLISYTGALVFNLALVRPNKVTNESRKIGKKMSFQSYLPEFSSCLHSSADLLLWIMLPSC